MSLACNEEPERSLAGHCRVSQISSASAYCLCIRNGRDDGVTLLLQTSRMSPDGGSPTHGPDKSDKISSSWEIDAGSLL